MLRLLPVAESPPGRLHVAKPRVRKGLRCKDALHVSLASSPVHARLRPIVDDVFHRACQCLACQLRQLCSHRLVLRELHGERLEDRWAGVVLRADLALFLPRAHVVINILAVAVEQSRNVTRRSPRLFLRSRAIGRNDSRPVAIA